MTQMVGALILALQWMVRRGRRQSRLQTIQKLAIEGSTADNLVQPFDGRMLVKRPADQLSIHENLKERSAGDNLTNGELAVGPGK